ncbi:unnamed protein product, partial [Amoebophrya sp. A25]
GTRRPGRVLNCQEKEHKKFPPLILVVFAVGPPPSAPAGKHLPAASKLIVRTDYECFPDQGTTGDKFTDYECSTGDA